MLRSDWEGAPLWRYMHPADHRRIRSLAEQMEAGPGFVELRLGSFGRWSACEVRTSGWTAGGASICVRRSPPKCATAITSATSYIHIDAEAEELLEMTASELEGTLWRDMIHPTYAAKYQSTVDATHNMGIGGLSGMPCMSRVGGIWKRVEVWTEPYPGGLAFCQFREAAGVADHLFDAVAPPPLPMVVSA